MAATGLAEERTRGRLPAGLAVSLALHLALAALLVLPAPPAPPPPDPGITVEIMPAPPDAPAMAPPPAPVDTPPTSPPPVPAGVPVPRLATPPAAAPSGPAAPIIPPGWTAAPRLLSGRRLAEPRNRAVAAHITAMPDDMRDEQLCDFEAVEQAGGPGRTAEQAVAYAFAEPRQEAGRLVAEGAAVRIGGQWYRLAFDCRVAGRPAAVVAFAYKLGAAIPRRLWSEHGLAAGGDD
jgi:hypothetical protein